ncbi:MAG: LPS export ABC transporter periplasmic protein LptC [Adhaeribacter sp.]
MKTTLRASGLFLLVVLLSFCKSSVKDIKKKVVYKGPIAETTNVSTLYSDSARLQIKLSAPLQLQYENQDGIYPKGIHMTFYDRKGQVTNTVRANYGKYDKKKDQYFVRGNVVLDNAVKKETLRTEELYWEKNTRKIHTDKFVTIETETDILKGTGLTANQDFSDYEILNPSGEFILK